MSAIQKSAVDSPHVQAMVLPGLKLRLEIHYVGMICFLTSEVAFFSTLVMSYIYFLTVPGPPPHPKETLSLPLTVVDTLFLLSSSLTIHLAQKNQLRGQSGRFLVWWAVTILLGCLFLGGTAIEWNSLIHDKGLTIDRNMFGSAFYTLVGFHALHVTIGAFSLSVVWVLIATELTSRRAPAVDFAAWYWHFVDAVWVVVFSTVYLFGR